MPTVRDPTYTALYHLLRKISYMRHRFLVLLLCFVMLAATGCDDSVASPQQTKAEASLSAPKPDPKRDEAAELITACGKPTTDRRKIVRDGTQRILSWHRSGVDVFFIQNRTDSPRWASTAVFVGEDTINRKTLSGKMPCSRRVTLFSVDTMDPYLLQTSTGGPG